MNRRVTYGNIYVPTLTAEDEPRHIIRHRDGPTLCRTAVAGEQHAPADHRQASLCPRCVQVYIREAMNMEKGVW
jgi:hypothetical protein